MTNANICVITFSYVAEEFNNCVNTITMLYMKERRVFTDFIMCVSDTITTLITALSHSCTHTYIRFFKYFVSVSILTYVIIEMTMMMITRIVVVTIFLLRLLLLLLLQVIDSRSNDILLLTSIVLYFPILIVSLRSKYNPCKQIHARKVSVE